MGQYSKAIVAVLLAVAGAMQTALTNGPITLQGWEIIGYHFLIALAVYLIPNSPPPPPPITLLSEDREKVIPS